MEDLTKDNKLPASTSTVPYNFNDVSPKYIIEDWAKEEAKRDFQNTVQAKAKFYDLNTVNPENSLVSNTARPVDTMDLMDIDNNKPFAEGFSVQDTHTELSDGRLIPKYERYYGNDFDHEDFYGKQQDYLDKWGRGAYKFANKTLTRAIGGTVGVVYGLGASIAQGDFSYLYDNDFSNMLNDYEEVLNTKYANFKTKDEREAGLFGQMTYANFWADTVADGAAYVTGMVASEGIWAALTGGASTIGSMARFGAKKGFKGLLKSATSKGALKDATKILKNFHRAKAYGKTGDVLHNIRFTLTSGVYESSQEALHSLQENTEGYVQDYKSLYGHAPSAEDIVKFRKRAIQESNHVFAFNIPVTSFGNMILVGKKFGVTSFLPKNSLSTLGNKIITKQGSDKMLQYAVKEVGLGAKTIGRVASVLSNPVSEGIQEGIQGTISGASKSILQNQFNTSILKENLSRGQSWAQAFEEAFTTKEGLTEVFVGGIIGGMSNVGHRAGIAKQGGKLFGTGWGDRYRQNMTHAEGLQASFDKYKNILTNEEYVANLLATNGISASMEESQSHEAQGNLFLSNDTFKEAIVQHLMIKHKADMLDDNIEDLRFIVNSSKDNLAKEGLNEVEIEAWQKEALRNIDEWSTDVKKAYSIGQYIGLSNLNKIIKNPVDVFVHSTVMGKNSYQTLIDISKELSKSIDKKFVSETAHLKIRLGGEIKTLAEEVANIQEEIDQNQLEMKRLVEDISIQDTPNLKEGGEKITAELNAKEKTRIELSNNLQDLRTKLSNKKQELEQTANTEGIEGSGYIQELLNKDSDFVSAESLMESLKQVKLLQEYVQLLKNKGKEKEANRVTSLLGQFEATAKRFQDFNRTAEMVADPRFGRGFYKGIIKFTKEAGRPFTEDELVDNNGALPTIIENHIKDRGDKMTEDDAYTLRAVARMVTPVQVASDNEGASKEQETPDSKVKEEVTKIPVESFVEVGKMQMNQDVIGFKRRIIDFINRVIENTFYIDSGMDELTSYKAEEVEKFMDLSDKKQEEGLTEDEAKEFTELQKRFKNIFLAYGTNTGEGVSLGDLLEIYLDLDENLNESEFNVEEVLNQIDNLSDLESKDVKRNHFFAQSYDKAIVSRKRNKLVIHNISIGKFIDIILEHQPKYKVSENEEVILLELQESNNKNTITIKLDDFGNIEILPNSEGLSGKDVLLTHTPFSLENISEGAIRNYHPLYQKYADGSTRLVSSDFPINERGDIMNPEDIYEMREGDKLSLKVDTSLPFNRTIVSDYFKNPTNRNKAILYKTLNIQLVNSKGRVVGVLKSTSSDTSYSRNKKDVEKVREKAVDKLLEMGAEVKGDINLDFTAQVTGVHLGYPAVTLRTAEDGGTKIISSTPSKQSISKIINTGYMLNGKIELHTEMEGVNTKAMMGKIFAGSEKGGQYRGKKVPFVVIDFYGKKIAYPVGLSDATITLESKMKQELQGQDNSWKKGLEQVKVLNSILTSFGLLDRYGTLNEYSDEELSLIIEEMGDTPFKYSIERLVDNSVDIETIVKDLVVTNVDFSNLPFHSPKFTYSINKGAGQDTNLEGIPFMQSGVTTQELPFPVIKESKEEQKNNC